MKIKQANLSENAAKQIAVASSLKLNKILVPIDFSNGSKKALQYAVHFAKKFNASIILLHVLPRRSAVDGELAGRLNAWAEEFVPNDIPAHIQTCRGTEAIEIVNAAKKFLAGLMVISTHGRTGRAHALAGSLAENLVQLASCPILVVREREHDFIETAKAESPSVQKENRAAAKMAQMPDFIGTAI